MQLSRNIKFYVTDKAINSYKKNYNHIAICDDLTKLSPQQFNDQYNKNNIHIDIIVGGPPCFIEGTTVLTNNGYKNIENVKLNDKLLTHTGIFQNIINLQNKIYNGYLYKIKHECNSTSIICTSDHPFYVRCKEIKNNNIYFNKPIWKNANELTLNDYFGMIINEKKLIKNDNTYYKALELQREYLQNDKIYKINNNYLEENNNCLSFIEDNYVWYAPLEIIKEKTINTKVYNFEVENDNSYIVENIIVHNCQGMSIAGKRDINDPRNSLFMEFIKYLNYYEPKAFIMENVIGILSMKTKENEKVIDIIMNEFNINYNCIICKLYASDFEVPQNRRRTIIIGINKKLNIIPTEPVPILTVDKRIPVKNILLNRDNIDISYYLSDKAIQGIKNKKEKSILNNSGFGAQYLDLNKPSYTIPARYWKDGYDALVKYSDTEIRRLTILELKRIQSFPDNYIIEGSKKDIIMQIGNAVACKFAYHLGKHLIKLLDNK